MTMLRRDFLKTLSAFAAAAAAAAGGGAAASAAIPANAPSPVLTPEQVNGSFRWMPAKIDLQAVRGEDFFIDFDLPKCPLSITAAWFFDPASTLRGNFFVRKSGDSLTRLELPASHTARIRPRSFSWVAVDAYRNLVLAGTLTVLPDGIWNAEEEVLAIVPQMYPLGIITKRDGYEVGFRAKLAADERSRYDDQIGTLVEHCRPTGAEVFNRGAGCLINFAPRGIL